MCKVMQLLRSALCAFAFIGSASALAGQNILFYTSQPGDTIGQGLEVTITGAQANFSGSSSRTSKAHIDIVSNGTVPFVFFSYTLDLGSANGVRLLPGSYEGALIAGLFQNPDFPGLLFTADNRTCNTVTGRFDLLEAVYDGFGGVISLAVDFEQHCNGAAPALFGQIRFNSDIPVVTKPLNITRENPLNTRGCVEASSPGGALVSFDVNDATDATGGRSLAFSWSSTTGAVGTAPVFSFNAPITTDPQNPAVVTLSLTDLTNNTVRTATKSVCVSDTTGPVITINSPVPGQTVIGDSLILDVTIKDAVDKNITQYETLVGSDYLSPHNPSTGRARENVLASPKANGSIALTITVRATDASGNTSQKSVTVTQFP
jgi:hypothetical protein